MPKPHAIIQQVRIPDGYALVQIDCTLPKQANEEKGFLWVTEDEYRKAKYDPNKDGRKLPIYFIRQGIVVNDIEDEATNE